MPDPDAMLESLVAGRGRGSRCLHVERLSAREAEEAPWPAWVPEELRAALAARGVTAPWRHQAEAAEAARSGRDVVVATGTASGKSLAYQLPAVTAALEGARAANGRGATVLYLAPTKALAHDQLASLQALDLRDLRAATYDGDTPDDERAWVRAHASFVLTNPDLLHRSLLPGHHAWAGFLRVLRYVVVDECHAYRGVFGSHVANVLRRLRRVAGHHGSQPVFVLASASSGDPAGSAARLIGRPAQAVVDDASPRGETRLAMWEPPLTSWTGENDAPVRRAATAEVADLLADLVAAGTRTLAFVRSRRGAEVVAATARDRLADVDPDLARTVAAYRGGYLPEERRAIERDLRSGRLLGVAATNALELGIDVQGLDAVLMAGWPGTRASLWQQAGRAGRAAEGALAVLVARDDPLDTYLVHHPEAVVGAPVEVSVCDPQNPYVLAPHLVAAAAEVPLTPADAAVFGPGTEELCDTLVDRGWLRRRPRGWFWTRRERAADLADLRGIGGGPTHVVEESTGRLLGTVDPGAAHTTVHAGAVYIHQGLTYLVSTFDLEASVAFATRTDVDHTTFARESTDLRVLNVERSRPWCSTTLSFGSVEVTSTVVSYLRRRVVTGEVLGEEPLDLPPRTLRTRAVWWTADDVLLSGAGLDDVALPGAVHAAEHAAIGLLPLFATCDRWDIGGVSTALHPDTGEATVFVYDGHPGGAGFAERGYAAADPWWTATRDAISACECADGCPSCVQSPKCGNGNEPLDKAGAVRLLDAVLASPSTAGGPPPHASSTV